MRWVLPIHARVLVERTPRILHQSPIRPLVAIRDIPLLPSNRVAFGVKRT